MEQTLHIFSVDLKKEESIQFALLQAKLFGPLRQRKVSLILSVGLMLMTGAFCLWDWQESGKFDLLMAIVSLLMVLPAVFTWCILPGMIKSRAARQYDQAVKAGNSCCGELRLYPDRVEKQTESVCAKIALNRHTLFIESPEMMAFINGTSPAVVLPARCATDDMATVMRAAADKLPLQNRRFIARLQPQAQPVDLPVAGEKPPILWQCDFTYTTEEYVAVGRHSVFFRFWKMAPITAGFSLLMGLLFGWDGQSLLLCVLYFLLTLGLVTLFNLVLPLRRVKQAAATIGQKELSMSIAIDPVAVRLRREESGEAVLLWEDDLHIYDKAPFAEFARKRDTVFFLPKRCIPDIPAFEEVITRCRENK